MFISILKGKQYGLISILRKNLILFLSLKKYHLKNAENLVLQV